MTDRSIQHPMDSMALLEQFEEWKREQTEAGEPMCAGGFCNGEDVQLTWGGGAMCAEHRLRDGFARVDVYPDGPPYGEGFAPEDPAAS